MIRKLAVLIVAILLVLPSIAGTTDLTAEDFVIDSTEDLIDLCTPSPNHPLAREAIHFCHGFCVGAFRYYLAVNSGPTGEKWVCLKEPYPSRNTVIKQFVEWAKAHPQYMNENPVETLFRYLIETYPCSQ